MGAGCPHTPELKIPAYAGIFNMEGKLLFSLQTSFIAVYAASRRVVGLCPTPRSGRCPDTPPKGRVPLETQFRASRGGFRGVQ